MHGRFLTVSKSTYAIMQIHIYSISVESFCMWYIFKINFSRDLFKKQTSKIEKYFQNYYAYQDLHQSYTFSLAFFYFTQRKTYKYRNILINKYMYEIAFIRKITLKLVSSTFLYFNKIILELIFWTYLFPAPAPPRSKPGLGFNPPANRSPKPKHF